MKKKTKAILEIGALCLAVAIPLSASKADEVSAKLEIEELTSLVYAEGEAVSSSEETASSSEEPVSSEESSSASGEASSSSEEGEIDWSSIEINGKTIEQWYSELMDESTRRTAIISLTVFGAWFVVKLVMWLADRGLIKSSKLTTENATKTYEEAKAAFEEIEKKVEEVLKEAEEATEKATKEAEEISQKAAETANQAVSDAKAKAEDMIAVLTQIIKDEPTLVAQGTYKKIKQYIEGATEEEEVSEDGGEEE